MKLKKENPGCKGKSNSKDEVNMPSQYPCRSEREGSEVVRLCRVHKLML